MARNGATIANKTQREVIALCGFFLVAGLVAATLVGLSVRGNSADGTSASALGTATTGFLVFIAAGAVGALLGFLLGLPRARVVDDANTKQAIEALQGVTEGSNARQTAAHFLTNSNLIKVSDWLTTIIVGLGLVNLRAIGPALGDLSSTLEEPLGGASYSGAVGLAAVLIGGIAGALMFYAWTSITFRNLMEAVDGGTADDDDDDEDGNSDQRVESAKAQSPPQVVSTTAMDSDEQAELSRSVAFLVMVGALRNLLRPRGRENVERRPTSPA